MFSINGEEWFIKFVNPDDYNLLRSDNSLSIATCDDTVKTIFINCYLQGDFLKKVLCHELTHAAMFSYNIYLTIEQEEILADIISTYGEEIITNKVFYKIKKRRYE